MKNSTIGMIIVVMLLWASCYPLITLGIEYAPHLTFAAMRAVIAGLALILLAYLLKRPLPRRVSDWCAVMLIGFGATSLGFLGMFHAADLVSPGTATVITNTQPLLAAILASIVLKEKLSGRATVGLIFGFLGILIIASPHFFGEERDSFAIGLAYIILAALGITISNVFIKKISGNVDLFMAMGFQMLFGSVPLIIGALITEEPGEVQWSYTFIAILLVLSLFGTALVYLLWFSVLKKVPLSRANAFSFLVPVFGLTIGVLFYSEILSWLQLAGVIVTIIGVSFVVRGGARANPEPRPPGGGESGQAQER